MLINFHISLITKRFLRSFDRHSDKTVTLSELLLLLLLLLKNIGNARPGEGDCHPISQKTPAPHYKPIEEKKRKGK